MKNTSLDIAAELARLEGLTNFELRSEWRRLHAMQPPKSLSRDLLLRGITYKFQEGRSAAPPSLSFGKFLAQRLKCSQAPAAKRLVPS